LGTTCGAAFSPEASIAGETKMKIADRIHSYRIIAGTEHPIYSFVEYAGSEAWLLHSFVCNGETENVEEFDSREDALAALEE